MIKTINIKLVNENGKLPSRAHASDAGYDVFTTKKYWVMAQTTVKIPLGFAIELPEGHMAVIHSKSGLSSRGIIASNAPVDSGYRGEVHAIITNTSTLDYVFNVGEKVAQMVIIPIITPELIGVGELGFGERGENGFGSTGK